MSWLDVLAQPKTLMTVGLLALFWSWETLHPFRAFPARRGKHAARNLGLAVLNTVLLTVLLGGVTALVASRTERQGLGLLHALSLAPLARLLLALLLLDAWMYLWHRVNHAVPLLWRFHRMHHTDAAMDVTTATRFHLGELFLSGVLRLALIPVLGLTLEAILVYDTLVIAVTQFHHSNISLGRWDRWVRWLLVTPAVHQVHHSRWKPETDSNYGVLLPLWDRLARTFRLREDGTTVELGLEGFDEEDRQTISGMLLTPFIPQPRVGERPPPLLRSPRWGAEREPSPVQANTVAPNG